jgi:hypothetical protein
MEWLEEAGVERARIELSKGDNWVQVKDFSVAEAERVGSLLSADVNLHIRARFWTPSTIFISTLTGTRGLVIMF